jgi:Cu-Zn family superoxide dismutase
METYDFFKVDPAICFLTTIDGKDKGYCILTKYPNETTVELFLHDLPSGTHGFHIHESTDRRGGFDSLRGHYNPYHKNHGGLNAAENHLGDLGNINVSSDGTCRDIIHVNHLPLMDDGHGIQVIGRSIVIHADPDDKGKGGHDDSLKTGHAGKRIASGVIGYL